MTQSQIEATIKELHRPELAQLEFDLVYQVWEDGSITLQKCGELLWHRYLLCVQPGDPQKAIPIDYFPCTHNGHGFIFADKHGAERLRSLILESTPMEKSHG